MENTIAFRTRDQREYDKTSYKAEEDHEIFEEMMKEKEQKLQDKGSLSEEDIDDIFLGLGTIIRNGREMDELTKKINPGIIEKKEAFEKDLWDKKKAQYLEEEHGIRIIK